MWLFPSLERKVGRLRECGTGGWECPESPGLVGKVGPRHRNVEKSFEDISAGCRSLSSRSCLPNSECMSFSILFGELRNDSRYFISQLQRERNGGNPSCKAG